MVDKAFSVPIIEMHRVPGARNCVDLRGEGNDDDNDDDGDDGDDERRRRKKKRRRRRRRVRATIELGFDGRG